MDGESSDEETDQAFKRVVSEQKDKLLKGSLLSNSTLSQKDLPPAKIASNQQLDLEETYGENIDVKI